MKQRKKRIALLLFVLPLAAGPLTACSNANMASRESAVAMAYNTPGLVKISPYRRTIFSSTDF